MAERRDAALGPSERRRRARPPRPDTRGQRGQQQQHSRDAGRDVNQNARPSSSGPLSSLRAALKRSTSNRAPSPAERHPHPPHRNSDTPDLSDFQTYYAREDYEGFYAPFELPPSYEEAVFGVLTTPDLQQGAQALQYEAISESRPRQRQALQPNQASRQIQADLPERHSPRREQARRPERAPRPSEAHVEEQQTSGRTHDSAVPRSGLVSIATQTASEDISEEERDLRRSSTATASAPPRPPPPRLTINPVIVTPLLPPPPAATSPRSPDHCLLDLPLEAEDHLSVLPATTIASQAPVASSLELLSARPVGDRGSVWLINFSEDSEATPPLVPTTSTVLASPALPPVVTSVPRPRPRPRPSVATRTLPESPSNITASPSLFPVSFDLEPVGTQTSTLRSSESKFTLYPSTSISIPVSLTLISESSTSPPVSRATLGFTASKLSSSTSNSESSASTLDSPTSGLGSLASSSRSRSTLESSASTLSYSTSTSESSTSPEPPILVTGVSFLQSSPPLTSSLSPRSTQSPARACPVPSPRHREVSRPPPRSPPSSATSPTSSPVSPSQTMSSDGVRSVADRAAFFAQQASSPSPKPVPRPRSQTRFGNGESRVGDAAPLKPKPNVRPKSCVLVLPPGDGTSINGGGAKGCREDDARRPSAPSSSVADAVSSFSAMASTNSCGRPLMPQGPKPMAVLPSKPLLPPKPGAKQAGSAVPAMQGGSIQDLYAVVNKRPAGTAAAAAAITQGGGAADLYAVVNKRSAGAAVAAAASMERPQVDPASWSDEERDDGASGGRKHGNNFASLHTSTRRTLEGYPISETPTLPLRKPTIIRPTASDVAKIPRKPSQFQASTRYGSSRSLDELGDNNRASESRASFTDDLSQCLKRPSTQKVPPKKPPPPRPSYLPGNTRGPARTDATPRGRSRERRGNDVNNENAEDQQGDLPPRPGPGHPLYNSYMLPMPHVLTRVENQAKAPNELSFKPYEVLPLVAEQDGVWLECRRGNRVGRVRRSLVNIVTPLDDDGGDDGRGSAPGNSPCAEVLYDFTAEEPGELSLAVGDTVRMLGREPGGEWLRGELRGKTGIFPACYVRVPVDVEDKDEISSGPRCLVRFTFEPGQEDELALEEGTVVALCARDPGGEWARGRLRDGREGLFPLDFVEILEDLPLIAGEEKPQVKALYDFFGEDVEELSFKTGDVLTILGAEGLEWLKGELNGKVGIFPKNYVTEI
uniref:SH3 domain-containing protein 19-like isoform X1 n=1 Tax=Petromyzon marinus TaxID=7757 RepID=A0AAJ7UAC6_PETMA|nr:SH3 domain-containing protein 19-like isoform X1 [Petromyzon marinus]